jgi:hypothetical protein
MIYFVNNYNNIKKSFNIGKNLFLKINLLKYISIFFSINIYKYFIKKLNW